MKSTDNTVFVRFVPPSCEITRFHLQNHFSQIGPIKKCSIIRGDDRGLGYGFCKFVTREDAETAALENGKTIEVENKSYRLTVELASAKKQQPSGKEGHDTSKKQPSNKEIHDTRKKQASSKESHDEHEEEQMNDTTDLEQDLLAKRKRTCRVILRNVSFHANEQHLKAALEREYGPVLEVNLPRVSPKLHRGFAFCTFEKPAHAAKAVQPRQSPLMIKKRPVAIDYSVSKHVHQQLQQKQAHEQKEEDDDDNDDDDKSHEDTESDDAEQDSDRDEQESDDDKEARDSDDDEQDSSDDDKDDSGSEGDDDMDESKPRVAPEHDDAVSDKRSLFIRNLPFDSTRHDLFQLLSPFGHIDSIYLVKDKATGVAKGTAFCCFHKPEAALKVLEAAGSDSAFVTQRQGTTSAAAGLHLNGRRLFVDLAVDKKTAATLTVEKQKATGKDRRNLYLKLEGRVANQADSANENSAWENLPETDQLKRQRAFAEKNTKLRSPLFFINPLRLSIRNLSKQVDETLLKKLCVMATKRGLDARLVSQEDQVAHWRAGGEMTTRDIMKRIEEDKESTGSAIPPFDDHNIKRFIPSVFIDRDFTANKKEKGASRGFGFVDFQHHAHALACLRELNNNPFYSAEFVAGGKRASEAKKRIKRNKKDVAAQGEFVNEEGRALIPRLIVDFTVENKAKARKQAEHRAQQQANNEKQRLEQKEKKVSEGAAKKQKKSRGGIQREKKRKQKDAIESGETSEVPQAVTQKSERKTSGSNENGDPRPQLKQIKPPAKKHKIDKDEQNFDKLVESYRATFSSIPAAKQSSRSSPEKQSRSKSTEKRWFE